MSTDPVIMGKCEETTIQMHGNHCLRLQMMVPVFWYQASGSSKQCKGISTAVDVFTIPLFLPVQFLAPSSTKLISVVWICLRVTTEYFSTWRQRSSTVLSSVPSLSSSKSTSLFSSSGVLNSTTWSSSLVSDNTQACCCLDYIRRYGRLGSSLS